MTINLNSNNYGPYSTGINYMGSDPETGNLKYTDALKYSKQQLSVYDVNNDGIISKSEMPFEFQTLDVNGNGKIDNLEAASYFMFLDKQGTFDGNMTQNEIFDGYLKFMGQPRSSAGEIGDIMDEVRNTVQAERAEKLANKVMTGKKDSVGFENAFNANVAGRTTALLREQDPQKLKEIDVKYMNKKEGSEDFNYIQALRFARGESASFDKNADGVVTVDEVSDRMKVLDTNGDGKIGNAELAAFNLLADKKVDFDGVISSEERTKALRMLADNPEQATELLKSYKKEIMQDARPVMIENAANRIIGGKDENLGFGEHHNPTRVGQIAAKIMEKAPYLWQSIQVKFMGTDAETGELNKQDSVKYAAQALKGLDRNDDGQVSTVEVGQFYNNIDIDNNGIVDKYELAAFNIFTDRNGIADGVVNQSERQDSMLSIMTNPYAFKEELSNIVQGLKPVAVA